MFHWLSLSTGSCEYDIVHLSWKIINLQIYSVTNFIWIYFVFAVKKKIYLFCSDRFRTTINIIGDALGASIISRFCKKYLEEDLENDTYSLETNVCNKIPYHEYSDTEN